MGYERGRLGGDGYGAANAVADRELATGRPRRGHGKTDRETETAAGGRIRRTLNTPVSGPSVSGASKRTKPQVDHLNTPKIPSFCKTAGKWG